MQIKKISLYSVPYTEDDHHQPLNSGLPEAWTPIKNFNHIKSDLFNFGVSVEITAFYEEIRNANYVKFTIDMGYKTDTEILETYYAWIDRLHITSQQALGSIRIYYHWDWWRTLKDNINPLRGIVIQRKKEEFNPPQLVPNIIESYDKVVHDIKYQNKNIAWIYMATIDPPKRTPSPKKGIQRIAFPVHTDSYTDKFQINASTDGGGYVNAPSFRDVIDGKLLSTMEIDQNKLIGCCVSFIPPIKYDILGNQITIPYKIAEKEHIATVSIYAYDMIEHYEQTLRAYDDIFTIELSTPILEDPYRRIKVQNDLKWWCFPKEDVIVKFDKFLEQPLFLRIKPSSDQYYLFLWQLKNYFSGYDYIKRIIINSDEITQKYAVRYGKCKWDYTFTDMKTFIQIFENVDTNKNIVEIEKVTQELFNVKFDDDSYMENVSIGDILLKRPENNQFTFLILTTGSTQIITSIDYGDEASRVRVISNDDGVWPVQYHSFEKPLTSTPTNNLYLMDHNGYPITKFEQGRDLLNYSFQVISQNAQMFVLYKFNKGSYVDGTEFAVNMTPIDMTQEYYNEYIISGERAAANEQRVENIVSTFTNLAANAALGAILGGPAGGAVGTLKSVGKTLLTGGITTGVVGGALGYYQQSQLENRLKNRGSFLIRGGSDYSWLTNGYLVSLVQTKYDEYSNYQYQCKVDEFGIECNEIDIDGNNLRKLLSEEGPLKLLTITLDKDIPQDANTYIRQKLTNGIYLDSTLSRPPNINNVI